MAPKARPEKKASAAKRNAKPKVEQSASPENLEESSNLGTMSDDTESDPPPKNKSAARTKRSKSMPTSSSEQLEESANLEATNDDVEHNPPKRRSAPKKSQSKPVPSAISGDSRDSAGSEATGEDITFSAPNKLVRPTKKKNETDEYTYKFGIHDNLPPIYNLSEIFEDMTKKSLELGKDNFKSWMHGNTIKIATMCSGTESPILALMAIKNCLSFLGVDFEVEHIFSAEIVTWKQAYIERNFSPPILFRDIRDFSKAELDGSARYTAYGAVLEVPGGLDFLIAGSSCVDLSKLNAHKKTAADGGETGDTLWGVLDYVKKYRPKVLILENVRDNKHWETLRTTYLADCGYVGQWFNVDAKEYYIPQTRQRAYMMAICKDACADTKQVLDQWCELMSAFKRPASSSVDKFLLSNNDPLLANSLNELKKKKVTEDGDGDNPRDRKRTTWVVCKARHRVYRHNIGLGQQRTLTQWRDGGSIKVSAPIIREWLELRPDREKDYIELAFKRGAARGYDINFVMRTMDMGQGVDREFDKQATGTIGCLVPNSIMYLSREGRPLTGVESLILQGLPVQQLHFARETQAYLHNLAGNAMTSTVVGAAILSALISGSEIIGRGHPRSPDLLKAVSKCEIVDNGRKKEDPAETANLTSYEPISVDKIVLAARQSARLCEGCERYSITTRDQLLRCKDCGYTSCARCDTARKHNYEDFNGLHESPEAFESLVKCSLPMRTRLPIIPKDALGSIWGSKIKASSTLRAKCIEKLQKLADAELAFSSIDRGGVWTIHYHSEHAHLKLVLGGEMTSGSSGAEWQLFLKPDETEPGNSMIRSIFNHPVLRMVPTGSDVVLGAWQVWKYKLQTVTLSFQPDGQLVPSFKNNIGLDKFVHEYTWNGYSIVPQSDSTSATDPNMLLGMEVAGVYKLFRCGDVAEQSLYVQQHPPDTGTRTFLFYDVGHYSDAPDNAFVLSTNYRRLNDGERRMNSAELPQSWRPPVYSLNENETLGDRATKEMSAFPIVLDVNVEGNWEALPTSQLQSADCVNPVLSFAVESIQESIAKSSCEHCHLLLQIKAELPEDETRRWQRSCAVEIDEHSHLHVFASLIERASIDSQLRRLTYWNEIINEHNDNCTKCAPPIPITLWPLQVRGEKQIGKLLPYEDRVSAAVFQRALRARPAAFRFQVKVSTEGWTDLKFAINPITLVHRAAAKLGGLRKDLKLSWCLKTHHTEPNHPTLPRLTLPPNISDPQAQQPPGFKANYRLRPEQLRSLSWMIHQENTPLSFSEVEVEEAVIHRIGWRIQGRAVREIDQRGGILCDDVGYGKTITTLALIDSQRGFEPQRAIGAGSIATKATLVCVSPGLAQQWQEECEKFLEATPPYNVMVITKIADLNSKSVRNFRDADIIIVSWAVFESKLYMAKVAHLAGKVELSEKFLRSTRATFDWYKSALDAIGNNVEFLLAHAGLVYHKIKTSYEQAQILASQAENETTTFTRHTGSRYVQNKIEQKQNTNLGESAKYDLQERKDDHRLQELTKADDMRSPIFEMFEFRRIVVDEFPLAKDEASFVIQFLKAKTRWILSATPRMENFADIKKMAALLGINLGVDDISPGYIREQQIKAVQKDQSNAEKIVSLKTPPSVAWHEERHRVAQTFLGHFARKNIAELGDIPASEHFISVELPAAERAIYLELLSSLEAHNFSLRTSAAHEDNDRALRIREMYNGCKSAGETLLRCATSYQVADNNMSPETACSAIIEARRRQFDRLMYQLEQHLWRAESLHRDDESTQYQQYESWKAGLKIEIHDSAVAKKISEKIVIAESKSKHKFLGAPFCTTDEIETQKKKLKEKKIREDELENLQPLRPLDALARENFMRNLAEELEGLTGEAYDRARSLRFLEAVSQFQKSSNSSTEELASCYICSRQASPEANLIVLSSCGHVFCTAHLREDQCCPAGDCGSQYTGLQVVQASEFQHIGKTSQYGKHYSGAKLSKMVQLLKKISPDEQVLLFIQFRDWSPVVEQALGSNGISFTSLFGDESDKKLNKFRTLDVSNEKSQVLILGIGDDTAAGSNLTRCNHVIFLSPYLTDSTQVYDDAMKQAIGRARRFGQSKHVHIYHFLALKTIDVDTVQRRRGKVLTAVKGQKLVNDIPYEGFEPSGLELVESELVGEFVSTAYSTDLGSKSSEVGGDAVDE